MSVRPFAPILTAALAAAALFAPVADARPARHAVAIAADACPNADALPTASNLAAVRGAILCLHNQIRAGYGLPPFTADNKLSASAAGHSASMVRGRYFDHTEPGGATFISRLMRSGYRQDPDNWALGENLAWGTDSLATPAATLNAWMNSPDHRANILQRAYRAVGIGVQLGVPTAPDVGATFTVDFAATRLTRSLKRRPTRHHRSGAAHRRRARATRR